MQVDTSSQRRRIGLELVVLSFVVLFQELALIRWLPAQVRVLAYFPNLILISAFLGLGLGCLRAGKRPLLWLWPLSMLALIGSAWAMSGVVFTQESASEFLWMFYHDLEDTGAPVVDGVRLPIAWGFIGTAITFIPLGQLVAERLRAFRELSSSLWGYACDIAGSLLGVIAFSVGSFLGAFPIVWFGVVTAGLAPFFLARRALAASFLIGAGGVLFCVVKAEKAERYSPYYALTTSEDPNRPGFAVMTNGSLHQNALPMSKNDTHAAPGIRQWMRELRRDYHLPYRLLASTPKKGLVVGAGTGNDVASMLDEGVPDVTAVEIDPLLYQLGLERHPNKPYSDPRVRVVIDDGRAFLNRTEERYDLIVFGTMDSLTRLSALSNVRLDNFIYTKECFTLARDRLAPGGGFVVLFDSHVAEYIRERQIAMLTEIFGEPPRVQPKTYDGHAMFFSGAAFTEQIENGPQRPSREEVSAIAARTRLPTDDWPFLYLVKPGISGFYASLMALFAALSVAAVAIVSPQMRRSFLSGGFDAEMFLFGVAFLLLETRSVTAMNLAWGATWLTSAIVFGAILFMVLAGTIAMALKPLSWSVSLVGLVLTLVAAMLIPTSALLDLDTPLRLVASVLLVGAPVFFASTCFALRFKARREPDAAFGWNLIGAVAGGLTEFFSMAIGLRALLYIALAAYLGVALLRARSKQQQKESAPSSAV
jgi:spermidine synthase